MTDDRIDKLKTILRLRRRDLDQCEREVAAARQAVATCEDDADEAARACALARSACDLALTQQASQPCDPFARLHVHASSDKAEAAQQLRAQARAALDDARQIADRLKREWLRAQVRHDAIYCELDKAIRQFQRQMGRRMEEEIMAMPTGTVTA